MVRTGSLMSPGFIFSIIFRRSGEMSFTLSGPINPAFAFDGESEISEASFSKFSPPAVTRRRIPCAFSSAASSAPTLMPFGSVGVATRISRSVTVGAVVNSFMWAS